MLALGLFLFIALGAANLCIYDPSDTINPADWEADNAIIANYNEPFIEYLPFPIVGPYYYNDSSSPTTIDHQVLYGEGNDTSVVVVTEGAEVTITHSTIVKFGYASSVLLSSFYGVNAAVNVANGSTAYLSDINITTHNGAANLFSYGTGSVAYVHNAWLYNSGPVAHGLYAGGNGSVFGTNVEVYTGGLRCSAFSGDNPAGYVHIDNAVAHTDGIGSAICYALGLCNMTNVIGHASQSPAMFSDGPQTGIWTNSDITAGLLGGIVMFSSREKVAGASVTLDHTHLTTLGETMPGFWFGNLIAEAHIISSILNLTSNILAVANFSQITQDFNVYGGYNDNPFMLPADGSLFVSESQISGDLVAYNGSTLSIHLANYSSWEGTAYSGAPNLRPVQFGVSLDSTSQWRLTSDVYLQNFTTTDTTFSNVIGGGFNIFYNASAPANAAWSGKTYNLSQGGRLMPWRRHHGRYARE